MKLLNREKWFYTLLVFSWLVVCNLPVAETAFVMLHDFVGAHEGTQQGHRHHTNHHPGHSVPHKDEGMPGQKPHGMSSVHYVRLSSATSLTSSSSTFASQLLALYDPIPSVDNWKTLCPLSTHDECRNSAGCGVEPFSSRAPPVLL